MSEPLPTMLHASWAAFCDECRDSGQLESTLFDGLIKLGFELCFNDLRPLLTAALPCVEAMERDTRMAQADGGLLVVLATMKELVEHGS